MEPEFYADECNYRAQMPFCHRWQPLRTRLAVDEIATDYDASHLSGCSRLGLLMGRSLYAFEDHTAYLAFARISHLLGRCLVVMV